MSLAQSPTPVIVLERPIPGVTVIRLNRPERLNAMTTELGEGLHQVLDRIAIDADCRVVILTGAGRGFCAGLDLTGYGDAPNTEDFGAVQRSFAVQKHIAGLMSHMRSIPQPIIAAVNGAAAGGGLALFIYKMAVTWHYLYTRWPGLDIIYIQDGGDLALFIYKMAGT